MKNFWQKMSAKGGKKIKTQNGSTYQRQGGFTLIEMFVAVTIFAIVMTVATGSVINIIDANLKSQAIKVVMNNLNIALEAVSKDIRFGADYDCDPATGPIDSCWDSTGSDDIGITGSSDIVYSLGTGGNAGRIMKDPDDTGPLPNVPITAPDVVIEDLVFYVSNGGGVNPMVLITLRGYAGRKSSIESNFELQTLVAQRNLQ